MLRRGSVEVTPHHLFLSHEMFDDTRCFCQGEPAAAERTGAKGAPVAVGPDRCCRLRPCTPYAPEKKLPFSDAPSGVPGVETTAAAPACRGAGKKLQPAGCDRKDQQQPGGNPRDTSRGFAPGCRADFALFKKEAVRIEADNLHCRCGWTPFEGRMGVFPSQVIMDGTVVYEDGEFFRATPSWIPGKGIFSPVILHAVALCPCLPVFCHPFPSFPTAK